MTNVTDATPTQGQAPLLSNVHSVKAVTMIYDENYESETGGRKELIGTWIFTIGAIALIMLVLLIFG